MLAYADAATLDDDRLQNLPATAQEAGIRSTHINNGNRRSRRSRRVDLILIGAASALMLGGCGDCSHLTKRVSQDIYTNRIDCEADKHSPRACEWRDTYASPLPGRDVVLGPAYEAKSGAVVGVTREIRTGSTAIAVLTDDVRRGGFGISAACHQSRSYTG
jgi:uncharacterized protein YgiB involved in biofilm formation